MALTGKRRGRKPSKATAKARTKLQKQKHYLYCHKCDVNGAEVDGDITKLTCGDCMQTLVEPPVYAVQVSEEEKRERKERKAARIERKRAIAAGEIPADTPTIARGEAGWHFKMLYIKEDGKKKTYYSKGKKITKAAYKKLEKEIATKKKAVADKKAAALPRGWHFKLAFAAKIDGKQKYFSRGKEVTKAAYKEFAKQAEEKAAELEANGSEKFARGWHWKPQYVGPEGEMYMSGEMVSGSIVDPSDLDLELEFEQLMEQHMNGKKGS